MCVCTYSQYWGDYPELFASISKPSKEIDRAVSVFKWYVSTLYGSFSSRKDREKIEKKPFNPILGKVIFLLYSFPIETSQFQTFNSILILN